MLWPRKNLSLLFCLQSKCDYWPQAMGNDIWEIHYKPITQVSKNIITCTPIQHKILYKPLPHLFITDWLSRHNHEMNRDEDIPGMCITINTKVMHRYTRLYDSRRNKNSNARWQPHWHAVRTHTLWLAIKQSWGTEGPAAILIIRREDCNHIQHCNERQNNNNYTWSATRWSTIIDNREDKVTDMWVYTLILKKHDKNNTMLYKIPGMLWK